MEISTATAALWSMFLALVSAVVVKVWFGKGYVRKCDCKAKHEAEDRINHALDERVLSELRKLRKSNRVQFKMLRSIVVHLPIDKSKQEDILNADGGGE